MCPRLCDVLECIRYMPVRLRNLYVSTMMWCVSSRVFLTGRHFEYRKLEVSMVDLQSSGGHQALNNTVHQI